MVCNSFIYAIYYKIINNDPPMKNNLFENKKSNQKVNKEQNIIQSKVVEP